MKRTTSWMLGSAALLAVAAALLLGRPQPLAGALTPAAASKPGGTGFSSPVAGRSPTAAAQAPMKTAATPAAVTAPPAAATPHAPKLPFSYVGHWTGGGRTRVMLQRDGITVTVQGPGPLDADYDVQAVGDRQVTLLHRASGTRHALDFDVSGGVTTTGASGAQRGLQQARPVAAVPPAHAPANSRGDTEDQQEGN